MIWIIHLICINTIFIISKIFKNKNIFIKGTFLYSIFIFGQRWMTGTDFPNYLKYYLVEFEHVEILYKLIQNILSKYNIYFGVLIFSIYLITLLLNYKIIITYNKNVLFTIYIYVMSEVYFAQLSQIRQWLSIALFVNAFYYFYSKNKIKGLANIILGIGFHKSIIILLPFLFFKPNIKKKVYILLLVVCFILPFVDIGFIGRILPESLYGNYYESRFNVNLGIAHLLKYYCNIILGILVVNNIDFNYKNFKFKSIINGFIFYMILYGISFKFAPILRISYYLKIFEVIFFGYSLCSLKYKIKQVIEVMIIGMTLLVYMGMIETNYADINRYQFRRLKLIEDRSDGELWLEINSYYSD